MAGSPWRAAVHLPARVSPCLAGEFHRGCRRLPLATWPPRYAILDRYGASTENRPAIVYTSVDSSCRLPPTSGPPPDALDRLCGNSGLADCYGIGRSLPDRSPATPLPASAHSRAQGFPAAAARATLLDRLIRRKSGLGGRQACRPVAGRGIARQLPTPTTTRHGSHSRGLWGVARTRAVGGQPDRFRHDLWHRQDAIGFGGALEAFDACCRNCSRSWQRMTCC